jgi:hypothetical protein
VVALHAEDRGVDEVEIDAAMLEDRLADTFDGGLPSIGVADDTAFADVGAASFELRFDEDDDAALPGLTGCAERAKDCRQDESRRDERDIHREEDWGGFTGREKFAGCEKAGVGALAKGDTGIVAKLLRDLAVAGIDGEDGGGAALEHAVGEATGGSADVDARETGERDGPMGKGTLELEAAAADVFEIGAEETNDGVCGDRGTRLIDTLLVNEDTSSENESLCALAGGGVTLIDEKLVDAKFRGFGALKLYGVAHDFNACDCMPVHNVEVISL